MFDDFVNRLAHQLSLDLPGEAAQYKMAPPTRMKKADYLALEKNPKQSAVLILLYPFNEQICTVLIERATYDGAHSAQISFPGGKFENDDITLENTAIREAYEEIGIDKNKIKIIAALTDLYIPASKFLVQPFVAICCEKPVFNHSAREVQKIIEVPLQELSNPEIIHTKKIKLYNDIELETPYYKVHEHTVWGATAIIISEFLEVYKSIIFQ